MAEIAPQGRAPITVLYWYDGTTYAGMETVLVTFLNLHDRARVKPVVVWAGLRKVPQLAREIAETGTEQIELTPAAGTFASGPRRAMSSLQILRKLRPDILHLHSSGALTHRAQIAFARGLGIPVVRTVHMPFSRFAQNAQALRSRWQRAAQRWLARSLARVIAVSNADRSELAKSGLFAESACVTISNGTRLDRFRNLPTLPQAKLRLGLAPDQPVLGLVGRLCAQKQFNQTIEAMPAVLREHPKAKLLIVGDGPDAAALRAQANALGISSSVNFFGHREDVPQCFAAFDLFAAPSLYESQGLIIQEAMAAGRPIVASPLPCFLEMLDGSGAARVIDGKDPARLAQMYSRLLADPEERARMGEAGRERVKSFSGELNAVRTQALYDEVLAARSDLTHRRDLTNPADLTDRSDVTDRRTLTKSTDLTDRSDLADRTARGGP